MDRTKKFVLILILTNVFLWLPLLTQHGIIIQRDFHFPLYRENFLMYHYPTWNHIMSQPTFEQMIRIPMRLPFLVLVALGVDVPLILKLLIVTTTTLLSVSMFLFLLELRSHFNLKISDFTALIASLLFAFNPTSLQFLGGISLLFSVGILPLLLKVSMKYSESFLKYSVFSAFLLLLSLGHPFVFFMNFLIWAGFTVIVDNSFWKSLVKLFTSGFIFLGFSAWYFLPYFANQVSSISLGRAENLAYSTFKVVSDNNILKIILLERDRFLYVHTFPESIAGKLIHLLALDSIIIISFFPLFFKKKFSRGGKRIHLLFLTGYMLSVLFALGEKSPTGELYYYFISTTPVGWIFRSPLKFQLYEMFFLAVSFAVGFDVCIEAIIQRINRNNGFLTKTASAVLVLFILGGMTGYGIWDANYSSFNPIQIPKQFYEINSILESLNDTYRVLWYPRYNERPTIWSKGHYVSPFDMKSSRKPTYNTYWNYNYVNTLLYEYPYSREIFKREYFYTFLGAVGVKYIAFHNDRNLDLDNNVLREILKRGVQIYSKDEWYLVALNSPVNEYVFVPTCFVEANSMEDIYQLASLSTAPINSSETPESLMRHVSVKTEPSGRISGINLDNIPLNWTFVIDPASTLVSKSCESNGGCYLNITTTRNTQKTWDFIISNPITVSPYEKYLIVANLKSKNLSGSHVKVNYYNITSGKWELLSLVPLKYSSENGESQYWGAVDIPTNISKIRVVIASGWVEGNSKGSLLIEDVGVYRLHPCQRNPPVNVVYTQKSSTQIEIYTNASAPFLLAVNEVYDPGWRAEIYVNNTLIQTVGPARIYGFINGFWINSSGNLKIIIKYHPQELFNLGLSVSLLTSLIITLTTAYFSKKNKKKEEDRDFS